MKFSELYFGYADAKTEASKRPESFVRSYIDHHDLLRAVMDERRFLVLGPKGTGKSALAWYLQKKLAHDRALVQARDVSELPIADVGQLKTGESPGITRSLNAWKFLLLCALIDVILQDQGSRLNQNPEAASVVKKLREYGFLDPTPAKAILKASRSTWKVPIPTFGEIFSMEKADSLHLIHLMPYLQKWVLEEDPDRIQHLVVLDGLDSIYLNDERYIPALSALIQSAVSLNHLLEDNGSGASLIVLVRNDVFSRLDLPDGGKVRADFAVELDWRKLSGSAASAPLFDLVDRKAVSLSNTPASDVVRMYFPNSVKLGGHGTDRDPYEYLLSLTRHTPRDLLRLFEHIRIVEAGNPAAQYTPKLSQETIREGVLQYASKYFVDAIRNELVGRSDSVGNSRVIVDALRNIGSRKFTQPDYDAAFKSVATDLNDMPTTTEALRWLFFAGAIGNEVPGRATSYLQFAHRRDDNDVYLQGSFVLHNALVYAWSLPWN